MTFADAIKQPLCKPVFLVTIQAGVWLRAWVQDSGIRYKVPLADTPASVMWNNATALSAQTSTAAVASGAGRWYYDGTYLYVSTPGGADIWSGTVQALVNFNFGNHPKYINSKDWDPRIKSVPNISQRIEAQFGGLGQIGGGSLALINNDGFFDTRKDYQWNARQVTMWVGIDLPNATALLADYQQMAVWSVDEWTTTNDTFTLRLKEPKARVKSQVPVNTFERSDYPNIEQSEIGKAIPIAYGKLSGIKPVLIDPGARRYKVADHAIKSFDGLSQKLTSERTLTETVTDWQPYEGNTRRIYYPSKTPKKVTNNGSSLTEKSDKDDVLASSGSFGYDDGWLYVNVTTLGTTVVTYSINVISWKAVAFDVQYLSDGEFTVPNYVTSSAELSVDFTGKTEGLFNDLIVSAPDVVADLLSLVDETNTSGTAFNDSNDALAVGTGNSGETLYSRKLALYVSEKTTVSDLISRINAACGTFVFSDSLGQYHMGVFEPSQRAPVYDLDQSDLMAEWSEVNSTDKLWTGVRAKYATNQSRQESQLVSYSIDGARLVNNQPEAVERDDDLPFSDEPDAIEYSQRMALMQSVPLKRFTVEMKWRGFEFTLGDQITIKYSARGIFGKFEVLERNIDFSGMRVRLVLGDLRGLKDTPGFWVGDSEALPVEFAGLDGYGSGSVEWNDAWDPTIKQWARNNIGYWTDDNGFADTTDHASHLASTWT